MPYNYIYAFEYATPNDVNTMINNQYRKKAKCAAIKSTPFC